MHGAFQEEPLDQKRKRGAAAHRRPLCSLGLAGKSLQRRELHESQGKQKGKVRVDGPHFYSTDPSLAEERLIVALGATEVEIFSEDGTSVCNHKRVYMDSLDKDSLKTELRLMRDEAPGRAGHR